MAGTGQLCVSLRKHNETRPKGTLRGREVKCHQWPSAYICQKEPRRKHPGGSVNFSGCSSKCSEMWRASSAKNKGSWSHNKRGQGPWKRIMMTCLPPKAGTKRSPGIPTHPNDLLRPFSCVLSITQKSKEILACLLARNREQQCDRWQAA